MHATSSESKMYSQIFKIVNHKALGEPGIGEPLMSWLRSYLRNKYQGVNVFGIKPKLFSVTSGVHHPFFSL